MSNLLSDPILAWLEPIDILTLKQVNKEYHSVITNHIASQRFFHVKDTTCRTWNARQQLYKEYSQIESLLFDCTRYNSLASYLVPTLRSLHLNIPLWIQEERLGPTTIYFLINDCDILKAFQDILTYLERSSSSQLTKFTISLLPKVSVSYTYYNATFCGYDRNGPMYEDADIIKDTYEIPPVEYFSVLDTSQTLLIQNILLTIASKPNWKQIILPYHFPGAKSIPHAILTDIYEYDDIQEDIYEYLDYLRHTKN